MELQTNEPHPLERDIYLTPESIAIRSLVDALYKRIDHPEKEKE